MIKADSSCSVLLCDSPPNNYNEEVLCTNGNVCGIHKIYYKYSSMPKNVCDICC